MLVTPGNPFDIIIHAYICSAPGIREDYSVKGIILTGGIQPNTIIVKLVQQTHIPVISVDRDTYSTAEKITKLIIKIRPEDEEKINIVKEMIKKYVNVDLLINKIH